MLDIKFVAEPVKNEEAIKYFKDKVPLTEDEFIRVADEYKTKAYTIAGVSSLDIIAGVMEAIEKALDDGLTLEDFRQKASSFLTQRGYEGLTPYQADNIFRTNIQTAYSVGHYKQMTDPEILKTRPYWQYDAVEDSRTRPTHAALNGRVFPADHPIWDIWYPPNGYRCRCDVVTLSEYNMQQRGLKVESQIPKMVETEQGARQLIPDRGFDKNPAKNAWEPDISKYPKPLQKAYQRRLKGGENA